MGTHANGTSNTLANVFAINVLPVPVGPLQVSVFALVSIDWTAHIIKTLLFSTTTSSKLLRAVCSPSDPRDRPGRVLEVAKNPSSSSAFRLAVSALLSSSTSSSRATGLARPSAEGGGTWTARRRRGRSRSFGRLDEKNPSRATTLAMLRYESTLQETKRKRTPYTLPTPRIQ